MNSFGRCYIIASEINVDAEAILLPVSVVDTLLAIIRHRRNGFAM